MVDAHLADIRRIQDDGGIVVIKWDGERAQYRHTVVISRHDTDYVWRMDCDDIDLALREAIHDYKAAHPD
jgi:DNA transposition AAA+ family ATPase